MDVSLFLAWAIIILSLFMLIRHKHLISLMRGLTKHQSVMFLMGLITLIIGIFLMVSYKIWVANWRVVITIIAWFVFIARIIRIFCFDARKSIAR